MTIDRRVDGVDGILAHVGADNVKGGEAQGEWMHGELPERRHIINLQGQPGASPAIDRNKGLHNVLDQHKDKYKFVAEQTANFARDQGLSVTESLLAGMTTPPDVIVAANDDMALGAIEAVKAQRPRGQGQDHRLRRPARGAGRRPRRRARRHGRAVPGRAEPQGDADHGRVPARTRRQPESDLVLLTPIMITKDNLDKSERLGELSRRGAAGLAAMGGEPLLRMAGIAKGFPGVQALRAVDFEVGRGEVHALLGENGAGKCTLLKILAGAQTPDAGTITFDGADVRLASPHAAQLLGIVTIYQEFNLIPTLVGRRERVHRPAAGAPAAASTGASCTGARQLSPPRSG